MRLTSQIAQKHMKLMTNQAIVLTERRQSEIGIFPKIIHENSQQAYMAC